MIRGQTLSGAPESTGHSAGSWWYRTRKTDASRSPRSTGTLEGLITPEFASSRKPSFFLIRMVRWCLSTYNLSSAPDAWYNRIFPRQDPVAGNHQAAMDGKSCAELHKSRYTYNRQAALPAFLSPQKNGCKYHGLCTQEVGWILHSRKCCQCRNLAP